MDCIEASVRWLLDHSLDSFSIIWHMSIPMNCFGVSFTTTLHTVPSIQVHFGSLNQSIIISIIALLANAAAGMIAEGVSAITYLPTDIISQRQQVQRRVDFLPARYHNHRTWSIIRHVWKTEGLGGFYRGFLPYMIVHGPGSAVWWAFYEATKHGLNNFRNTIKLNENRSSSLAGDAVTTLLSGVVAGVASCVITNPLEVAKTRMQLLEVADPRERANLQGGFRSILVDIYRREGFGGLYKGMRPRVLVKIPGFAAVFLGYECLKEVCRS